MKTTQKSYTKERFKKDLEFLLSTFKSFQHTQNLLTGTAEESLNWYNYLIEDDRTIEEIKNCVNLNDDFVNLESFLDTAIKSLEEKKKILEIIFKRFKEELK